MRIPIYQVDAFTSNLFQGNPAAVCPLDEWLTDEILLKIAAENNLAETAFFVPAGDEFELRWFTPTTEVPLCGHATVATAEVIFKHLKHSEDTIHFQSRQRGPLSVKKVGNGYELNFPTTTSQTMATPDNAYDILDCDIVEYLDGPKEIAVLKDEETVRNMRPNFRALEQSPRKKNLIITAPGNDCDFVSRFFAPFVGIQEDPVTGSAHTQLVPYWQQRMNKSSFVARQLSERGGELQCRIEGDRVFLAGNAVTYLIGEINIPD